MSLTQSLAQSIARMEGWLVSNSVAQRNHNPGNLRAGNGAIGTDAGGYAIFPDDATGWAALERQVDLNIGRGLTLREFFGGKPGVYPGYAPAADSNNPTGYAATVAAWLGISPDAVLSGGPAMPDSAAEIASGWLPDLGTGESGGLSTGAILALVAAFAVVVYVVSD